MKAWARLACCCVGLLLPAAAQVGDIPLDDAGFTAYIQQKVQLYSPQPVAVASPLKLSVKTGPGVTGTSDLAALHTDCVAAPGKCPDLVHAYVQDFARTVQASAGGPDVAATAGPAVPGERAAFMAYAAAKLGRLMPDAKIEIDGYRLTVTRPGGHAIPFDAQGGYRLCAGRSFQCEAAMDALLATLRDWLVLPDRAGLRASLHIMASCNVVASVGNSVSCTITPSREPLAPFFRRAFANLEEVCFKTLSDGAVIPVTNADRKDLGLDIGDALELCAADTHDAAVAAKLAPQPSGGIAAIDAPYAASEVLFPADWSALAAACGGHMIVAVPSRDTLLYMSGDGEAQVAALGARARASFLSSGLAISSDVYRWNGGGWALATSQSTMTGGPLVSEDLMPHAPH